MGGERSEHMERGTSGNGLGGWWLCCCSLPWRLVGASAALLLNGVGVERQLSWKGGFAGLPAVVWFVRCRGSAGRKKESPAGGRGSGDLQREIELVRSNE